MKIAFLILTYDNPIFSDRIKNLTNDFDLYIHAKYPEKIDNSFKKYLIKDLVETSWGDFSLVTATVNMLKEAIINNYDYYILLSGDTYPLYSNDIFLNFFTKIIKQEDDKSIFDYIGQKDGLYKASQWFCLNNTDAQIIVNTFNKYKTLYNSKNINKVFGAPDEIYFLTVLNKEVSNYKYTNAKIMYTRWLKNIIIKHPMFFNKITKNDMIDIAKNNGLFIRKCFNNFNLTNYLVKKKLFIIYIGSQTKQQDIFNIDFEVYDIIILSSIDVDKIDINIINKCVYLYKIIWKFHEDAMVDICISNKYIISQWKEIIFTTETFNFKNIKTTNNPKNFKLKNYVMKTVCILDESNNFAYKLI